MSRLMVKNLPSYVTAIRLREHFEQKGGPGGIITDVKVALKPDGTSRRFGFLGYKTDKEALAALEWFNRTFIDTTRINITVVEGAKDTPTPRPNKRVKLDILPPNTTPSASTGSSTNGTPKTTTAQNTNDDKMREFMQVMQPRTQKGPLWSNDETTAGSATKLASKTEGDSKTADPSPMKAVKDDNAQVLSDLDWMRKRMKDSLDIPQAGSGRSEDIAVEEAKNVVAETNPTDAVKNTILQTSRIFLRNLAFSCSDDELLELFKPFGEISQIHIPLDPSTKKSKGMAYVTFAQPACALGAYEALDKKSFQGRLLHILAAVDRKGKLDVEAGTPGKKSLKVERSANRKATAGKEFNWSMLYMNSDAVASSIADRMNISKADILNPECDNAAVKLALAETHIIQETKSYLESQGVLLSSFSSRARSNTTILVKNIPYATTGEQIRELFEPHGSLNRVLVPPAGTMAVVEFAHADEASKAFRAVAYRRLGNSVIYLEKGPLGMFQENSVVGTADDGPRVSTAFKPITISGMDVDKSTAGEDSIVGGSTLFVKNLSFSTTTERLTQVFKNLPSFSFARVQTKPNPNATSPQAEASKLSMGYGFVGFKTPEAAKTALKGMDGSVLDGHALVVRFAGRGREEDETKDKSTAKSRTSKMIVKNVPFEATKKDIRELFGAHGHLKSVRLPRKFDTRSRGFAFLEFMTRNEAEQAYTTLRHTHLLGRHLVLEWADEAEQDLDALRHKAGVGYGGGAQMPGRKRKLEMSGEGVGDDNEEA